MIRPTIVKSLVLALFLSLSLSVARATTISNGTFESGVGVGIANNATNWQWTPNTNGERVNTLTNSNVDPGDGSSGGTHLIDPLGGSWFGYAENSSANGQGSLSPTAGVAVDANSPVLTFWWRFFTNETPGGGNTHNDRFNVLVEGDSTSINPTVATVNGTPMIGTNGPLWSPTGNPGLDQSFALYTSAWSQDFLDLSAFEGQTVSIFFNINDAGGGHSQSSGFALDNVDFVQSAGVPEPSTFALAGLGLLGLGFIVLRRKHCRA